MGLKIWTRWRAISARRRRRISSSLLPLNIGPQITSIQPRLPRIAFIFPVPLSGESYQRCRTALPVDFLSLMWRGGLFLEGFNQSGCGLRKRLLVLKIRRPGLFQSIAIVDPDAAIKHRIEHRLVFRLAILFQNAADSFSGGVEQNHVP